MDKHLGFEFRNMFVFTRIILSRAASGLSQYTADYILPRRENHTHARTHTHTHTHTHTQPSETEPKIETQTHILVTFVDNSPRNNLPNGNEQNRIFIRMSNMAPDGCSGSE